MVISVYIWQYVICCQAAEMTNHIFPYNVISLEIGSHASTWTQVDYYYGVAG